MSLRLPDYTALGAPPQINPPTSVASYNNATAPAQAMEQFGATTQEAGSKLQDIINVADVNNTMANSFQPKLRELAQNFYSLTGKAAMDGAPQYASQVQNLLQQSAESLTGQAARQFTSMAQPIADRELYQSSRHAGEQAKVYAQQSNDAILQNHLADFSANIIGDSRTAADERRLALENDVQFHTSIGSPPAVIAERQRLINDAFDKAQQGAVQQKLLSLPVDQQISLLKPLLQKNDTSGTNSAAFNLGNVKTLRGAANNTQNFVNPATPVDGAALAANTLRNSYQSMTLAQIATKWTGESVDKASAWASNVSKASGIAPGNVPNLNDPAQLASLLKGIATAEKSPADRANFTDDVISQGVQQSLDGKPVNTATTISTGSETVENPTLFGVPIEPSTIPALYDKAVREKNVEDKAQEQQYNNTVQAFAADPHFTSMLQVPDSIKAGFVNSPKTQDYLEARAEYNLKNSQNLVDADTTQYGSGFANLLQNIHSPNGISRVEDLYQYTGRNGILTMPGFDALKNEIEQKQTPEGQAISQAKNALFAMGKNAIFGQAASFGVQDPKGEELHSKWLALTLNNYQQGLKAGKSPTQLLDPESPDYVGKSIAMFTRSDSERIKDQLNVPPRTIDRIASDIQYGRISVEQARNEVVPLISKIPDKAQRAEQLYRFGMIKQKPITQFIAPSPE